MTSNAARRFRCAMQVAALVLAACAGQRTQEQAVPAPRVAPPPPELSTIVIPIRLSLTPLARDIDTRVPARFSDMQTQSGIDVRYDVARNPIRLSMVGGGLHSSTTIRYAIEACRGRFPCLSCGFREPMREAEIKLHTALQWDPGWRLRSTTQLLPVHYARRCEVTWFDFDVTGRYVAPVIEDQLRSAAALIDRELPTMTNVRPTAAEVWNLLQKPYEVAPRTWLLLEPTAVSLTPLRGNGAAVETTLQLQAFTRVVVGTPPAAQARPLPPLGPAVPASSGLRIPFDVTLPYGDAGVLATREFGGRTWKVQGRDLAINALQLAAGPRGTVRLTADIDYRGGVLRNYRGPVVLEGTPVFDSATATLIVPDLEYTLDAKRGNAFMRAVERAAHENVRASLRANARFPLGPQLVGARAGITRALNRQLAPGVVLTGSIRSIEPVSVTALADSVSIRLVALGDALVQAKQ